MTKSETAVRLRGLSKSYRKVHAVRDVDLTVATGEIVALLGPNGAGKSTTNELILGLVSPDAGDVAVLDRPPRSAVREGRVGAMLQGGALLQEATTIDVLRLMQGLYPHPLPVAEAIERAGLGDFLKTKTDKLSGGQAQRLRFALAILPDPELLILDEPTVAMDVELRRTFWDSMRDFASGDRTVMFATHYLEEADAIADRIVVLNAGRVVADGTGAEIKSKVAGRTISLAADSLDIEVTRHLPGVVRTERSGPRLLLHTTQSDVTLRALLDRCPQAADIEVTSARLEDAFLALTAKKEEVRA